VEREGDRPPEDQEFLPPEPAGPEPELGGDDPHEAATEQQTWQQAQQPGAQHAPGWQQQQGWGQQQGWQPQQQDWQQQGWQQQPPPPGYGYGYQPPPPGWQPPPPGYGYGPPPYGYYAQRPSEPDNGAAIGGFVTSLAAGALLLLTGGLAGPISLVAAPFGIHYSRKGKRAVDAGKTPKHRSLAQAGFVVGIVTTILSVLAIAGWAALIVVAENNEGFDEEFDNDGGGFDSTRVRAALTAARCAAALLG
jgi:hypothetical protein